MAGIFVSLVIDSELSINKFGLGFLFSNEWNPYMEEFGAKECQALREKWVPLSSNHTCEYIYRRGSEIAVKLILEAHALIPECQAKALVNS